MIQDGMIKEIQELKLAGYTVQEAYDKLKSRHTKVPTLKLIKGSQPFVIRNQAPGVGLACPTSRIEGQISGKVSDKRACRASGSRAFVRSTVPAENARAWLFLYVRLNLASRRGPKTNTRSHSNLRIQHRE